MPNRPGLIIANPDPGIRRLLRRTFATAGYGVTVADTAAATVIEAARTRPEMIILSASFTDLDATALIQRTRAFTTAPVIVLFQRGGAAVPHVWLDAGADECLEEPFLLQELAAQVRRLMARRSRWLRPHAVPTAAGLIEIDPLARSVRLAGRTLEVTGREFDLLVVLVRSRGAPVSFADAQKRIWGDGYRNARQNLRRVVKALRLRIEPNPASPIVVISLRGVGYQLALCATETMAGGGDSSR